MNKKAIVNKVAKNEIVSNAEIKILLCSKRQEYKSFGIKAVVQQSINEFETEIEKLTEDKDSVIVSDAIECMMEINPKKAIKIATKYLDDKRRFVQSSSLYVIAELMHKQANTKIAELSKKYKKNFWRYLSFLEALFLLNDKNDIYLFKIFEILNKTKSYHTQCAAINILDSLIDEKNKSLILNELKKFKDKNELPIAVSTTLDRVFQENLEK